MKNLITILIPICFTILSSAQSWSTLTVDDQDTTYQFTVSNSEFGPALDDNITSNLIFAVDNVGTDKDCCEAITTEITNKVAIVYRGDCSFVDQALNVQEAGGIAMIVCNYHTEGITTFMMEGESNEVTIPCVMSSHRDCVTILRSLGLEKETQMSLGDDPAEFTAPDLDPLDEGDYFIYPNPAQSLLQVQLAETNTDEPLDIEIMDFAGNSVFTHTIVSPSEDGDALSVGHLPPGIYVLQGTVGTDLFTQIISIE